MWLIIRKNSSINQHVVGYERLFQTSLEPNLTNYNSFYLFIIIYKFGTCLRFLVWTEWGEIPSQIWRKKVRRKEGGWTNWGSC